MELNYHFVKENTIDNIHQGYIAPSQIHGLGLFAKTDIDQGDILCVLDGQVMSWSMYHHIQKNLQREINPPYDQYIFMEWNALDEETLLVRPFRTKYSYINHSRTPNVKIKKFPLRLVAINDIKTDEEITVDYRCEPLNYEYIKNHGSTYL
jgi:SET domain-containing protein